MKLQGGYFSDSTTSSMPVETHIGIVFAQRGSKGRYWVEVYLTEQDDEILAQLTTVRFFVEPAALLRFAAEVHAILECGGTVTLPASGGSDPGPDVVKAPCPIERPYTPLFMVLREACSALIERMDQEVVEQIRLANGQDAAVSWQSSPRHEIMAQIAWDEACLNLSWVEWDGEPWAVGDPVRADWSPTYSLDLSALKKAALAAAHPRAWFESYALYILSVAQDYLIEFYRDGPTDDIPYQRHLIYADGTARNPKPVWVKHVLFKYDDRQDRGEAT